MNNNQENNTQMQQEQTPMQAPLSMGWYKFLAYFALWASALLNIVNAGNTMLGNIYIIQGLDPDLVYSAFEGLVGFDKFRAVLFLACAIISIITAVSLLKYKSSGPMLVLILYGANALVNIVSYIGEYIIVNAVTPIQFEASALIPSVAISIAMIFINKSYFEKRAHLFYK